MPTPFGKYSLLRKLAEGGMAEVFLARQAGLEGFEKLVVLKRILPALSKEENFLKMFLNEARVAARLNHPNVVQIWDLGKIEDLYFIAMEFVHGEDLREVFAVSDSLKRPPTPGLVCRILADTLAGLHYAHTRASPDGRPLGLVHRDVSPQNVLVTYEGSVKLVDFGIAKATGATSEQTQAGLFKGKFAYMSPEQSRGKNLDARSDVFSVGILMWELLTWRRLFKRQTEMATLIAVAEDAVPSISRFVKGLPEELDRICQRALARSLDERYGSAQDMRADLEALIRSERWEADAMALQRWMRELFGEKLRAQDNDIRAAGLASLEDFLLQVEEQTSITWMQPRAPAVKTPSAGLTAAQLQPLVESDIATIPTVMAESPSKQNKLPPITPPRPPQPAVASPPSFTPPPPIAATPSFAATSDPTAATGPARAYDPPGQPITSDRSTAKRPAMDGPSRGKRIAVIAGVATLAAGLALGVALWPQGDPTPVAVAPETPAPSKVATLVITTDAPAVISVDGKAQPLGSEATIEVKPGMEHIVTAQRPGSPVHTVHIPSLAAGERLPVSVKLK
jgi:serine/threonine-protein kinase